MIFGGWPHVFVSIENVETGYSVAKTYRWGTQPTEDLAAKSARDLWDRVVVQNDPKD